MPYRLGLIGDLHAGSRYALVPPKWQNLSSDSPHSKWLQYIYSCWEHFVANCPPLDVLIVNGDIIEGESPSRRDAMDAITDNFLTQGEMAEHLLGTLLDRTKPRQWWLTRGTSYHDGKHSETIEAVARNLKAQPWADHRWTGEVLEGTWRGLSLNVTHHTSLGAIYPGTVTSREALFQAAAEATGKANFANFLVRSHIHFHNANYSFGKWVVILPCWKIVNPYAIKRMTLPRAQTLNDIGAVVVETTSPGGAIAIDNTTFHYASHRQPVRSFDPASGDSAPEASPAGGRRAHQRAVERKGRQLWKRFVGK